MVPQVLTLNVVYRLVPRWYKISAMLRGLGTQLYTGAIFTRSPDIRANGIVIVR